MKNKTQPTPLQPRPEASSVVPLIVTFAIATICILAALGTSKITKELRRNVTCHECDHVVSKNSATTRKKFKHLLVQDEKYETLYFCKGHSPQWSYAVLGEFGMEYFQSNLDNQVNKNGLTITNITHWYHIGTNSTTYMTTNIGGYSQAKHLVY